MVHCNVSSAQALQSLVWHYRRVDGGHISMRDDEHPLLALEGELLLSAEYGERVLAVSYCLAAPTTWTNLLPAAGAEHTHCRDCPPQMVPGVAAFIYFQF